MYPPGYTAFFRLYHPPKKGVFFPWLSPIPPTTCILTVTLSGEIDHHRVKGVLQDLDQAIDEVLPRQLIVDCAGITFMDSSGIAVLLRLWQRMGSWTEPSRSPACRSSPPGFCGLPGSNG